jgi:tryptophanyl-tRNA synthetase
MTTKFLGGAGIWEELDRKTVLETEATDREKRKLRILSGIQPSGTPTLGNYLGAIQHWVRQQHEADSYFTVVDLHAMTTPFDPADLRKRSMDLAAALLACGIDPEVSVLFRQSAVPEHTELMWVLCTQTMYGELSRMTQFKDKTQGKADEAISSSLYFYPVLMAADILLYDADLVPVGDDQRQHVELTRDIAQRFNKRFGKTFMVPKADIKADGARIMGLDDPTKKMSKSAASELNYVALSDPPDIIRRKIKRAVTDSGSEVTATPDKPALTNLLTIFSLVTGTPIPELEARFAGGGYGPFKAALAEALVEHLAPIQERLTLYQDDPAELQRLLDRGAAKAREVSVPKIGQVRQAVGL